MLLFVKQEEDPELHTTTGLDTLTNAFSVLKYLVMLWAETDNFICTDYYFSSIATAEVMLNMGLMFIFILKLTTKKIPTNHLYQINLKEGLCQRVGLVAKQDRKPYMTFFVWIHREERYSISNIKNDGAPHSRFRWKLIKKWKMKFINMIIMIYSTQN